MIIPREDLNQIATAKGKVTTHTEAYWSKLVQKHGMAIVLATIDEIWLDQGCEVTAAQVDHQLGGIGMARVRAGDGDVADDSDRAQEAKSHARKGTTAVVMESTGQAAAAVVPQPTQPANAAPAAVTTACSHILGDEGSSTSDTAAGEADEPTNQENDMSKAEDKKLIDAISDRIASREIRQADAAKEIDCSLGALNKILLGKADIGDRIRPKLVAWVEGEPLKSVPSGKPEKARTPPTSKREAATSTGDLIERGEKLCQKLTEFGCEEYAATVSELVEKWRTVRSALSA